MMFLSFNSEDRAEVEQIARYLKDKIGLNPWFDQWELIPGEQWIQSLWRGLEASATCAVFVGKNGEGPWQNREVEKTLIQQVQNQAFRVIPVLLPDASKEPEFPPFLVGNMWVDFRKKELNDENPLWRLECGIRGIPPGQGRITPGITHPKIMPDIEFVNREKELQYITTIHSPQYLLISAPKGYGKTRLLESVKEKLQEHALCVSLALAHEQTYSVQDFANLILQQLPGRTLAQIDFKVLADEVSAWIVNTLQPSQRQVIFFIDEAEALSETVVKAFFNEFIPLISQDLKKTATNNAIKLRLICAGRYISHWEHYGSQIRLKSLPLTPFDFAAVHETVEQYDSQNRFNPEHKKDLAAHLMYFTGGHPGCMATILTQDFQYPIRRLVSKEDEYYQTLVLPVVHKIKEYLPEGLRPIFKTISVVRRFNARFLTAVS